MKLTLHLCNLSEAPKANGGKSKLPALAWSSLGVIYVVRWFNKHFFPLGRLIHESEHQLLMAGNELHAGHTWHFCARSWHAIRLLPALHASPGSIVAGHLLLSHPENAVEVTAETTWKTYLETNA